MWTVVGRSVEGRPLRAFIQFKRRARRVMVLGGFHGDEPKSVCIAEKLIDELKSCRPNELRAHWIIVPIVNPDGYLRRRRRNANLVDVNRNFPTANWVRSARRSRMFGGEAPGQEPEARAVMTVVRRYQPSWIITIHSIGRDRFCNNYDGPGKRLAERMQRHNGYPVTATIGYPTPGSFGTWAGVERKIPTITLELPSHHSVKRCWDDNKAALVNLW